MGLKIYSVLFILAVCVPVIHSWSVDIQRAEIVRINEEHAWGNISLRKINRNTRAVSLYMMALVEVANTTVIDIRVFGVYSNSYRELPVKITRNVCDIFNFEYKFVSQEIQGVFPTSCPIEKDKLYYLKDFVPDVSKFPRCPWPARDYYIEITMRTDQCIGMRIRFYFHIMDYAE